MMPESDSSGVGEEQDDNARLMGCAVPLRKGGENCWVGVML